MIVKKIKVINGNMGSKWIFLIFMCFCLSINQKHINIYAKEEKTVPDRYLEQISRLRKCPEKKTLEKVTYSVNAFTF